MKKLLKGVIVFGRTTTRPVEVFITNNSNLLRMSTSNQRLNKSTTSSSIRNFSVEQSDDLA